MREPKKVEIIKNNSMEYYNQFIGQTANVVIYNTDLCEYEVDIPSQGGFEFTAWSEDEVRVVEWAEDERDTEIETVTIGKAEYDELLEFWKYHHVIEE